MTTTTDAYVCKEKGAKLTLAKVTLKPLGPNEVRLDMKFCGLCHTDIHMRDNDWGISNYPLVAGHEGIGEVVAVGANVKGHKVGDVCGVGWLRDSCGTCRACNRGRDNLCAKGYQGTYLSANAGCWGKTPSNEYGCFAKTMHINEKFAFHIPKGMDPARTAPMMCAGITLWEPIADYVTPASTVGVVGLGGLGHVGVKLAVAVGAKVVVFSTHAGKEKLARSLGATGFVDVSDSKQMEAAAGSCDTILDTSPVVNAVATYLSVLAFGGTYVKLGIPQAGTGKIEADFIPVIFTQKKVAGSIVCGSSRTRDMLTLAASAKIDCDVEVVPFSKINETMDALLKQSNSKCRYVLKW